MIGVVEKDAGGTLFASWRESSAQVPRSMDQVVEVIPLRDGEDGGCSVPGGCTLLPGPVSYTHLTLPTILLV